MSHVPSCPVLSNLSTASKSRKSSTVLASLVRENSLRRLRSSSNSKVTSNSRQNMKKSSKRISRSKVKFIDEAPPSSSSANNRLSKGLSKGGVHPSCPDLQTLARIRSSREKENLLNPSTRLKQPLSEAKAELFSHRVSGFLIKRGFGGFRRWVKRFLLLRGRMLSYHSIPDYSFGVDKMTQIVDGNSDVTPRGTLELTKHTVIRPVQYPGIDSYTSLPRTFGIEIIPFSEDKAATAAATAEALGDTSADDVSVNKKGNGGKKSKTSSEPILKRGNTWMLVADSESEQRRWLNGFDTVIRLIERVELPATLRGLGSVYDHFEVGRILGRGRFGIVRECHHKTTKRLFALKITNKTKAYTAKGLAAQRTLRNELRVLRRIKLVVGAHPHICGTFEVYDDEFMSYIVLEHLCGGDLFDRLTRKGRYTESDAASITRMLTSALQELHNRRIIHRDVKPENILFASKARSDINVKLADFGCALILPSPAAQQRRKNAVRGDIGMRPLARAVVGTPGYIAPEVILRCHYSPKCDVWAVGVILYIMLVGYPPFYGANEWEIFERTKLGAVPFHPHDWGKISKSAKGLVKRLLHVNPEKRASTKEILAHPWLNGGAANGGTLDITQDRLTNLNTRRKEKKADETPKAEKEKVTENGLDKTNGEKNSTMNDAGNVLKRNGKRLSKSNSHVRSNGLLNQDKVERKITRGRTYSGSITSRPKGCLTYSDREIENIRKGSSNLTQRKKEMEQEKNKRTHRPRLSKMKSAI
eukprot:g3471.t1